MWTMAGDMLKDLERRLGTGVTGLDFSISAFGREIRSASCKLACTEEPGMVCLCGSFDDIEIQWRFRDTFGGIAVSLDLDSKSEFYCESISPLIVTYVPEGDVDGWRTPALGFGVEHVGLFQVTGSEAGLPSNLFSGMFHSSSEPGLFLGTLLPQCNLHSYTAKPSDNGIVFQCSTVFGPGQKVSAHFASEKVWACADLPPVQAFKAYAFHLPLLQRTAAPIGWNSWDYYFNTVRLGDVTENMEAIRHNNGLASAIQYIVVDGGWNHTMGEWEPNYRLPGGVGALADLIRSYGFTPGIWTAPVCVEGLSLPALRKPDMLVKNAYGDPQDSDVPGHYILDPTHPAGEAFLREMYGRLYSAGFRFFKVDFVSCLEHAFCFHDPAAGPYDALRRLFRIIREEVKDSHILGCSLPSACGPGVSDSGRVGIDIHNCWGHVLWAVDSLQLSWWQHHRVWCNDADFMIVRGADTSLELETNVTNPNAHNPSAGRWRRGSVFSMDEASTWCNVVRMSGGSVFLSDRIGMLNVTGLELLQHGLSRPEEAAVPLDLFDCDRATLWLQRANEKYYLYVYNWLDEPCSRKVDLSAYELFVQPDCAQVVNGKLELALGSHCSTMIECLRKV